jgi:hypothetical protein
MGEKANTEVIEQLKSMAQQQEPGLRDRVMQLLNDYETVTGLTTGAAAAEESETPGDGGTPPTAPQA